MLNISTECPEIDLDALADEVGKLREGAGESIVAAPSRVIETGVDRCLRVVAPSWGGRIEPKPTRILLEEEVRYQCGR